MDLNEMKNKKDNFFGRTLIALGWFALVAGVIGSWVLGTAFANQYESFNTSVFIAGLFSALISSFLILGIGETINILNDNRRLLAAIVRQNDLPNSAEYTANSIVEELPEL